MPQGSWEKGSTSYVMQTEGLLKASSCVPKDILHLWKDLQIGSNLSRWRINKICENLVDGPTV